jgi:hypothetical protein
MGSQESHTGGSLETLARELATYNRSDWTRVAVSQQTIIHISIETGDFILHQGNRSAVKRAEFITYYLLLHGARYSLKS